MIFSGGCGLKFNSPITETSNVLGIRIVGAAGVDLLLKLACPDMHPTETHLSVLRRSNTHPA